MLSPTDINLESNVICPECSSIPLLGLNFDYEKEDLTDLCELYSYCIFNHNNKNKILNKNNFDKLFINNKENNKKYNSNIKCEYCKKNYVEYYCIECQRNICSKCFENHKKHKYYYNKDYLSEEEINKIKNKFIESKNNNKKNLDLIQKKIKEFESELNELKSLYEKYKDINDKLIIFSNYILNLYIDLVKSKKGIYYPIYFNLKNILIFNSHQLEFYDNDISINSFKDNLNQKLISGYYFIITNSNYSYSLCDYNKLEQESINYDALNIKELNKIDIKYDCILHFTNDKFLGIKYNDSLDKKQKSDIFNIKNQKVETTLSFCPENLFYNKDYNILILMSSDILYIINPKDYSIKQEFSTKTNLKKVEKSKNKLSIWGNRVDEDDEIESGEFIYAWILSANSFVVVFDGDIRCLGEEYENLVNLNDTKIINSKCFDNEKYDNYNYLIIYEKQNEKYVPKKIIILVQNKIFVNEVSYVPGKDFEIEDDNTYCNFQFDSMIKISDDEFIISFKCEIEVEPNQSFYYITETEYKNEYNYYYLNINKDSFIKKNICSTNNKSYLIRNEKEGKFFFIYYKKQNSAKKDMNKFFDDKNLDLKAIITYDQFKIEHLFAEKNSVLGWGIEFIYFGKIFGDELEIINKYNINQEQIIIFVSFKEKCIYYNNKGYINKADDDNNEDNDVNNNDEDF